MRVYVYVGMSCSNSMMQSSVDVSGCVSIDIIFMGTCVYGCFCLRMRDGGRRCELMCVGINMS